MISEKTSVRVRRNLAPLIIWIAVLALAALACAFEAGTDGLILTTATIEEAWLASDESGQPRAAAFSSEDETIYLFVTLTDASAPTEIQVKWVAYDAGGEGMHIYFATVAAAATNGTTWFFVASDEAWKPARYGAHVFLNGNLQEVVDFEIQ